MSVDRKNFTFCHNVAIMLYFILGKAANIFDKVNFSNFQIFILTNEKTVSSLSRSVKIAFSIPFFKTRFAILGKGSISNLLSSFVECHFERSILILFSC